MSFQLLACQTVLLLACRAPTAPVPDSNLSRVSLAFVLEHAGFKNALVLTKTVPLSPFDTEILTRDSLMDSGVVAVKEAVRDLLVSSRKHLPIDTPVIRALGAKPIARSPGADSFVGPRGPTLIYMSAPGYSSDSTFAVVYWGYNCGALCAGADLAIFRRDSSGKWKGIRSEGLWVS